MAAANNNVWPEGLVMECSVEDAITLILCPPAGAA
jgi:hypothetical protein